MLVIFGAVPVLYVVIDDDALEFGEVHADPDSALKMTVYEVAVVNPAIIIGLLVPDASKKVIPPSVEYWYFVNSGLPPVEPMNVMRIESVVPFTAVALKIVGYEPGLFVVTEDDALEFGEVQDVPESALKTTVYAVPAVNPAIVIGLLVPDASKKVLPPLVEYWYFVNAGFPPDDPIKATRIESVVPLTAVALKIVG